MGIYTDAVLVYGWEINCVLEGRIGFMAGEHHVGFCYATDDCKDSAEQAALEEKFDWWMNASMDELVDAGAAELLPACLEFKWSNKHYDDGNTTWWLTFKKVQNATLAELGELRALLDSDPVKSFAAKLELEEPRIFGGVRIW